MLTASDILFGAALPFALSLAVLLLIRKRWAAPLAIGVSFTLAFALIEGFAHLFPPSSAVAWLFYVGLLLTVLGLLDAAIAMPIWLRPIAVFIGTAIGLGLLLRFNFANHTWNLVHGLAYLAILAAIATIWWATLESTASEGGILMPVAAMLITGIGGLVSMLVADQIDGQALGALATALAGAALAGLLAKIPFTRGMAVVVSGIAVCALASAYFVSDVPMLDLGLVAIAPLLLFATRWLPLPRRPWLRSAIRLIITLIPLLIALGLAVAQFKREAAENSSEEMSSLQPVTPIAHTAVT